MMAIQQKPVADIADTPLFTFINEFVCGTKFCVLLLKIYLLRGTKKHDNFKSYT